MVSIAATLFGAIVIIFGILVLGNQSKIIKLLISTYKGYKDAYDKKYAKASKIKKVAGFILERPRNYYYSYGTTKFGVLLIGSLLMVLGGIIFLVGLGIVE